MDFREIASHTRALPVQIERTRVAFKLEAFKNLTPHPSPSRVKTLIHFPSRLPFSTLCPEETGRRRGARGDRRNYHNHFSWLGKKKKRKNDARVFRTSTGIIQVGSTRHNYAPTEWLSFFKPALTPARPRREHPHSCAPAKLHLPAAAPTTGAVAAAHPACLPRGRPQSTVNAIHVPSPSLRSLLHFLPASCNYFV